ncbi:hypothetical protein [Luteitalea sp.]|uniref:hypothetical protein n=1 Tax=Luteitalea sp. TaxID=2004800 RepID=UPI0025C659F2|nr:hypothetical protein [Luteitalea sp.]
MTKQDALRAARALLDGMAGTTEGEWTKGRSIVGLRTEYGYQRHIVATCWDDDDPQGNADMAHIARSCPARLGPVLRALMEGEE